MRWPFGPPHLTLKPSKKNTKKQNPQKQQKKKKRKKKEKVKTQKYQKIGFQLSVKIFFFWGGVQKLPFLTTWPRKRAPKKHYKNRGFSKAFLEKNSYASRNGHFWTKKHKSRNFSYHFFLPFSSLSTTKNTKISWNPYFYSVLANLKKRSFKILD